MNELPAWTDYTAMVGDSNAHFLAESIGRPCGLRIIFVGDGRVALDLEAIEYLLGQSQDAVTSVRQAGYELELEISGIEFTLIPVRATRRPKARRRA